MRASERMTNGRTNGSADGAVRRGELAAFLRSRRARITPVDVGLPPGLRRRTPGLRREEVAQLAGVGVTWYTWLEQGRPINASVQVLDAIARALRLDSAESEHLHRLAGVPFIREPQGGSTLDPEIQNILDSLDPLPATVYNGRYDVLAWNEPYAALFPLCTVAPASRHNAIWHVFTLPRCCNIFANPEEELPYMVATLRAAFGRHVGEPDWIDFIRGLSEASPEFAAMWAQQHVNRPAAHIKVFQHSAVGRIPLKTTSLTIDGTPETRLVAYTPTTTEGRERLARLRAMRDPLFGCPAHARRLSQTATALETATPA